MGPRGRPMVETAPKGWSQPGFWMGTRHNRGVLALESAKNPWSDERVVVRGERVSNPMNSIHGPYSTNESSWKRRYAHHERKFSPPSSLPSFPPARSCEFQPSNRKEADDGRRNFISKIARHFLRDNFCFAEDGKLGNWKLVERIEGWQDCNQS